MLEQLYRNADAKENQMNGLIQTPKSVKELQDWIEAQNDYRVVMAAAMTEQLIRSQYELIPKE